MILTLLFAIQFFAPTQFNTDMEKQPLRALTDDWNKWEFEIGDKKGRLETSSRGDWKNWNYEYAGQSGTIKRGNSGWSEWSLDNGKVIIKAYHEGDFDHWELEGDCDLRMRTQFQDSYDEWEITGDAQLYATPVSYSDYSEWSFQGLTPDLTKDEIVCMAFTFVFVSLEKSGII